MSIVGTYLSQSWGIMHLPASICPSVNTAMLAKGNYPQEKKKNHYQSKKFVCLSVIREACVDNIADEIDQLLILRDETGPSQNRLKLVETSSNCNI